MMKILIVCTGNSCRSQMVEGYLRFFAGEKAEIFSAGVEVFSVNPDAVTIMREDGIDISGQTSNHVDEYRHIEFNCIITACDHAARYCPYFPSATVRIHRSFSDPSRAIENRYKEFLKTRNEIKSFCADFVAEYIR